MKTIVLIFSLLMSAFVHADVFDFESATKISNTIQQTVNGVTVTVTTDINEADIVDENSEDTYLGDQNFAGQWVATDWTNFISPMSTTMTISFSEAVDVSSIKVGGDYAYYLELQQTGALIDLLEGEEIKGKVIDTSSLLNGVTSIVISDLYDNKINFYIDDITFTIPDTAAPEIKIKGNNTEIVAGDMEPSSTDYTDYGEIDISSSTNRYFYIYNEGDATLNLTASSPYVSVSGDSSFTLLTPPATSSIDAGVNTYFIIKFNPTTTGVKTATISIANDDDDENPYTYSIKGTGTTSPEINVRGNGISIFDEDDTPSTADHSDFESTGIIDGNVSRTFTIENTGSGTLTLGSNAVTPTGDFSVTTQPAISVNAGSTTTFTVEFNPTIIGLIRETLSIANDDANENPYNFDIQGTGTDNEAPTGYSVSFNDNDINSTETATSNFTFANAEVGTTYTYSVNSSRGGSTVTSSNSVANADQTVILADLSGLMDGTLTLSVTLKDDDNNTGSVAEDTTILNAVQEGILIDMIDNTTSESASDNNATFNVTLKSIPEDDVVVSLNSSNVLEGTVSIPVSKTLTFTQAEWNTAQTVTIIGVDDKTVDGNISYSIECNSTSSDSEYNAKTANANLINIDDDKLSPAIIMYLLN